jgi:hypothetical protein
MMKKMLVFLFLGMFLVSFVSTQSSEIILFEGWNLIYGFIYTDQIDSSYEKNIKAIYGLDPKTKEYIRIHPNPEVERIQAMDDDFFGNSAFWVYSNKRITTNYDPIEVAPVNEIKLFTGWNFLGSNPNLLDKEFGSISGDCDIQKIYLWNFAEQDWNELRLEDDFDDLYYGAAVKVGSDCTLGEVSSGSGGIPSLP